MPLIGAHLSTAGGYERALITADAYGCDTVQIFTKAPSQWYGKVITVDEARRFRRIRKSLRIRSPIGHDSYLINLASPDLVLYRRSIEAFVDEMRRAELLGLRYLVTHPGAHMGDGEMAGLDRVVAALDEVHERCPSVRVKVLLETTAGQGTCLGAKFGDLRQILRNVRDPKRLGVCLDTCHVLAAGYALNPEREYQATLREFDRLVGLRWLKVLHLNDSKKPCGSRIDRHEHIGQGHVGLAAFRRLLNDPRFRSRPMILETPKEAPDGGCMDPINLGVLRKLVRRVRT